ncbi:hypothetical protein KSP35_12110 [Aquihabitans sp. G128]|uniref:hypothetical protein n=1 Tax=Aquihabitans sp. G128 TaxID=2849779 RepID=UPI001C238C7B|nr:hypothetical protein [Aquihabitans sp. G128]QXC59156.1 hypothetical protein KSP35_12110 [Aquihabitans sp. G128]
MSDAPRTEDGKPIGGWVLRADPAVFDVASMLQEYGQVFRHPVTPGPRADLMDAGQPCFLFQSDTSKVVGIWAVGEVVAPCFAAPVDPEDSDAGEQLFAELELLPLEKAIAFGKIKDHKVLAQGELVGSPDQANPVVLRPEEVRALEEFDFAFVPPTLEQIEALQEALGEEETGLIFQLVGADASFGILDDGSDDELLSVVTVTDEGAFELGRFQEFADAMSLVLLQVEGLALEDPIEAIPDELPDGDPVAVLQAEDGLLGLYRVGPDAFDLYDPTEDGGFEVIGRFETLAAALAGLMDAIEEVDEDA